MVTNGFGIEGAALKETGAANTPESLYATAGAIIRNQRPCSMVRNAPSSARRFPTPTLRSRPTKMPAEYAARHLVDHGAQDWRDVITDLLPTLGRPTLSLAARLARYFRPKSLEWIAAKIPGAKLALFSAEELGSHFMFWENPAKFNAVVREFPGGHESDGSHPPGVTPSPAAAPPEPPPATTDPQCRG